jgi:hypothetical protein
MGILFRGSGIIGAKVFATIKKMGEWQAAKFGVRQKLLPNQTLFLPGSNIQAIIGCLLP